jgi:phosphoglucomutase
MSSLHPLAGKPATAIAPVDIPKLVTAYYALAPDPGNAAQRVSFGTSGHRGNAFEGSFNEAHVVAISQAIAEWRATAGITGPLFLGFDTHALSAPAFASALEVLAANGVEVRIAAGDEYTPTPAISHAILTYNRGRTEGLADGIVITPSHNPPDNGGFKYNPPNGGPADTNVTGAIQNRANELIAAGLAGVRRLPYAQARRAATTREHDFVGEYVNDLDDVIDFDVIRGSSLKFGVDPLGGAGVAYWTRIAERHRIALDVVSTEVDPTFRFMSLDWDGRVRMDPSSSYAMRRLIDLADRYDVAFACDTDHDRHGIVAGRAGLMPANHFLSVCVDYLFQHRSQWKPDAAVGKTLVSSALIDRVAQRLGRRLYEVPVGFKWFVDGMVDGSLGFGCEESAGASFLRKGGGAWSTDKDGIIAGLVAAEMTARTGRDPATAYRELTDALGAPAATRIDAPATLEQRRALGKLAPGAIAARELAGEPIVRVLDRAPGNDAPIGGIKVESASGWFAARPSGTEAIYKIYAESFKGEAHLTELVAEAQRVVDAAIA